jgi:hypothetical protein
VSPLLAPVCEREKGRNGRLSIQTDPRLYGNAEGIVEQAVWFNALAPDVIANLSTTRAGMDAVEEAMFEEKDMTPEGFDDDGPTQRTLRQFCGVPDDLVALVSDSMIPDPGT